MALPPHERDFDLFLSHAHKDQEFVKDLDEWLTLKAGFNVWYDKRNMPGGTQLASGLQAAIGNCRGTLLVVTEGALDQKWVSNEYNASVDEAANNPGFRVVALRVGKADTTGLMRGVSWIDVPEARLDANTAAAIISAFYPNDKSPLPKFARDVYISYSWRDVNPSAYAACRNLMGRGFRLIGDSLDKKRYNVGDGVEKIIASCGAFVAIIPYRGVEQATAADRPYKYFLSEIDLAAEHGVDSIVIADPRVRRADGGSDEGWLRMETDADACPAAVASELERLSEDWSEPAGARYVFYALDLESDAARATGPIRQIIEHVTGLPTITGPDVTEKPLETSIMKKVCGAHVVLADITDNNVNSCIEAGMGLASGRQVQLISRNATTRSPPFMLRACGQFYAYADDVEHIGVVHRAIRPFRRRIINPEM
jgi:hypothetical protein